MPVREKGTRRAGSWPARPVLWSRPGSHPGERRAFAPPTMKGAGETDSPAEGTGFEPSVPRERLVPSFSFTPTFPLARVNRPDPIPKSIHHAGPMVRIRLPPTLSQPRTGPTASGDKNVRQS